MAKKDETLNMRTDEEFVRLLDDWRRKQAEIPSRANAIRILVRKALDTETGQREAS